ncbi:hypothetical protein ACFSUK_30915 [Sphingobium scionense]
MDAAAGDEGGDIGFGDAAMMVGAGGDQQRGIVRIDRIEMEAQRHHRVEQRLGRGNMLDAGLHGPGAKARHVDAPAHGDGAILMPAQRPVGGGALVEQDGADRAAGRALMHGGMAVDWAGRAEQRTKRGQAGEAQARLVGRQMSQGSFDRGEIGGGQRGGEMLGAVGDEGEGHDLFVAV